MVAESADIDDRIGKLMNNTRLFKAAKNLFSQLKPLANAFDKQQGDTSNLADTREEVEELQPHKRTIQQLLDKALLPFHLVISRPTCFILI